MFDMMRPYVIIINLITLAWFIAIQYFRFKQTGRACSGDYVHPNYVTKTFNKASAQWKTGNNQTLVASPAEEETTTV